MTWETYYEKFYDWSTSTQISRMSSLTSFGASSEVAEVAQEFMDEKVASRFIKKAIAAGVQFTPEEIYDLSGCCDTATMNLLLESAKCRFTQEQLEDLDGVVDEEVLNKVAKQNHVALYITLSNGFKMPQLGYGVYQVTKDECERCVSDALSVGYRLIDTAQSYFNEEEVGKAIKKSGIPKNEIFLTTKVWIEHYGYDAARRSVIESMEKLGVDQLDLCLLHQPFADSYGAYRALEDMYDEGKIRAIGISNFYADRMVDFALFNRIRPMVNQIEIHPHNQQVEAIKWHEKYGVQSEAWAPFGEGRGGMFDLPELNEIAKKHVKTTAQVILRWHIQRGIVVIPKSTHIERMRENFDIFDFSLDESEMALISTLDKKKSSFFSHTDPSMVEWFSKMVEERKKNHDSSKEKKNW